MVLKVKYYYQRFIKKHIDGALFRRKVKSKLKKRKVRMVLCMGHRKQVGLCGSKYHSHSLSVIKHAPKIQKPFDCICLIDYNTLYTNFSQVNPSNFLRGISTIRAIEFVIHLQNTVIYACSDKATQFNLLQYVTSFLEEREKLLIKDFIHRTNANGNIPALMDNNSCFLFYMLALQNYDSSDKELSVVDKRNILNAYLYCSQTWLDKQQQNLKELDFIELALRIDIPVVEFKFYKDFKPQLYKASQLFKASSSDNYLSQFVNFFCQDRGVTSPSDYLTNIFNLFSLTASNPTPDSVMVDKTQERNFTFFEQYVIKPADCRHIWDNNDMEYLRNHFLIHTIDSVTGNHKYLILNSNFLTDKLYQGMMFDFANSILNHKGVSPSGKQFKNKADINQYIGEVFSEKHILYASIDIAFASSPMIQLKGEELKAYGVVGEPDYCLFDNGRLFLIEYKDVMLSENTKQSTDISVIKEQILDRLCKYEQKRKKGAGQLFNCIERIFNDNLLQPFEIDSANINEVYPIVLTTDNTFSALGVNALVQIEFANIMKKNPLKEQVVINAPTILDFDTFFNLLIPLRKRIIDLGNLIKDYIRVSHRSGYETLPFSSYVKDYVKIPPLKNEDLPILFGGLMDMLINESQEKCAIFDEVTEEMPQ